MFSAEETLKCLVWATIFGGELNRSMLQEACARLRYRRCLPTYKPKLILGELTIFSTSLIWINKNCSAFGFSVLLIVATVSSPYFEAKTENEHGPGISLGIVFDEADMTTAID